MGDEARKIPFFPVVLKGNSTPQVGKDFEQEYRDLLYEFFADKPFNTSRSYQNDLRQFYDFTVRKFKIPTLSDSGVNFGEIKRVHVVKFKNYLEKYGGRDNGPAAPLTIIRKLAAIKVWYDFLIEKDIAETNPSGSVRRPRGEVLNETQDLSDNETRALFDKVQSYCSSALPLHLAVITVLFTTGMRKAELISLKRKSLKSEDGIYYLEYIGKGGKKNKTALHPTTAHFLLNYLEWMREQNKAHRDSDPLFQPTVRKGNQNAFKKPLSASGVDWIVRHYSQMVVPDKKISPHSARATLIGSLLEAGEDLYSVSLSVGHSSVNTTKKYDKRKKKIKNSPLLHVKFYNKK